MNPLSEAAREASRRNGRFSKGPQTVLGRQISARNSFKHGLRGRLSTEPEFLPVWLRSFAERIPVLFGYITQRRREHLRHLHAPEQPRGARHDDAEQPADGQQR